AEDGIRSRNVTGVQTCALPISEEVNSVSGIIREKLYNDKKDITGPFDIIGDIHGCYDETVELLKKLGYSINKVSDDGKNFGIQEIGRASCRERGESEGRTGDSQ